MDVICDTNIWYDVGNGLIKPTVYKDCTLFATYLSIDELSKSEKLLDDISIENVRAAIQQMIFNKNVIHEPPFFRLLVESLPNYYYDITANDYKILEFTQFLANGGALSGSDKDRIRKYISKRGDYFQDSTDYFTNIISNFKKRFKNKSFLKKTRNSENSRDFISFIVKTVTKNDLPKNFDWTSIELFEKTFDYYFTKLEKTDIKIRKNDWYDLAFLVYVRPHQKIWTKDKRLKSLIKESGMGEYFSKNK